MSFRLDKRWVLFFAIVIIFGVGTSGMFYSGVLKRAPNTPNANVAAVKSTPAMNMPPTQPVPPTPQTPAAMSLQYAQQDADSMMTKEEDLMNMTTPPAPQPSDVTRADSILAALHADLDKYQDFNVALADGFHTQAKSTTKPGAIFHYNTSGSRDGTKLDPSKPNALLYQRGSDGKMHFVGVMFIANSQQTMQTINANFYPISQSIWHQHLDTCRSQDDTRKLGQGSEAACAAKGGVFRAASSWMTHLYLFPVEDSTASSGSSSMNM